MTDTFFEPASDGLLVRVKLHPAGRRDGVCGLAKGVDGRLALKATVTKAPEDGKANQALIKMLAKKWKVAKSSLSVHHGHTSRNKVLKLHGVASELTARLEDWATQNDL